MSNLAVIIPVWLQSARMFSQFRENIRTFNHTAIGRICVVCNRLSLMSAGTLEQILEKESRRPVEVLDDQERSVAGAWNRGIEMAQAAGIDIFLITAMDVALQPQTLEYLLDFHIHDPECDLWSSTDMAKTSTDSQVVRNECDFSCFMLRGRTIVRHGWFDKEYVPAYFEDNDYLTRVVLAGGAPRQISRALHVHQRSMTTRLDGERFREVENRMAYNRSRFQRKWGPKLIDYALIREQCFQSPFNSGKPLHWWPEKEARGYSHSSGIDQ